MEETQILNQLQKFILQKKGEKKQNKRFLSALQAVDAAAISFGEAPQYFFARMTCNSTGVGSAGFQGTETRRTVARDYETDEYLFVDGHLGAGERGLQHFFLEPGQRILFYPKSAIVKLAKDYGYRLHLQDFQDLNLRLSDHRLNRYSVSITRGPFTYPIRPVFAFLPRKKRRVTIGYVYEADGEEVFIVDPEDPKAVDAAEGKSGCAPWMLLGFVFPPLLPVAVFVWIVKMEKERMRG